MANKKFYWLKMENTFFDQKEIRKLRRLAGGDTLTIIYLKMQLLSLKKDGVIEFDDTEKDIEEQLELQIDENADDIRLTMSFLYANNLVTSNEYQDISFVKTKELIGVETASAVRVRKHRNSQKALQCNTDVTNCNIEIDKEIEIKKDKDKELEVIDKYFDDIELNSLFIEFLDMRKSMKAKNTERAIKLLLNDLNALDDDNERIYEINRSIKNSWKSIYRDKKQTNAKTKDALDWESL